MAETASSNRNSRGLDWFIGKLDAVCGVLDARTLRHLLMQAELDWGQIAPYIEPHSDTCTRRCVVRRENYEIVVLTWAPAQGGVAHDHFGSLCGLKVIHGKLTKQLYQESPDGQVRKGLATLLCAEQVTTDPGLNVHSLANSSRDEILVTVQVYSPPLAEMRGYAVTESPVAEVFLRPAQRGARSVAIVGGGFTGLMVLANLLRFSDKAATPLHFMIIDRRPAIGEGVAYRTTDARHLLNVPAGRMSAWPDLPEDFLAFARSKDPFVGPGDFLPRSSYGQYLRETMLDRAVAAGDHISAEVIRDEVFVMTPSDLSGWKIETTAGRTIHADVAILSVGHRPPDDPLTKGWNGPRSRFVTDPWASLFLSQINPDESVVLIGSGLTAVDVILTLSRSKRAAPIIAISRRGLIPKVHMQEQREAADLSPLVDDWLDPTGTPTIRQMVSTFRQHVRISEDSGIAWQQVIEGLRPAAPRIWDRLTVRERSRFLRHIRPLWEIHRHRMPPSIAETVHRLQMEGGLEVVAGAPLAAKADADGIDVIFCRRGTSSTSTVRAKWVVNCTGPGAHDQHAAHPFLRPLLNAGTLCSDELKLGLLTDDYGRAITASGNVHPNLLIAGTLRKATLWESTAVPELRQQAQTAANVALAVLYGCE
jgi:uncharacterized NAD(P)/FAD-binding protein YdhS